MLRDFLCTHLAGERNLSTIFSAFLLPLELVHQLAQLLELLLCEGRSIPLGTFGRTQRRAGTHMTVVVEGLLCDGHNTLFSMHIHFHFMRLVVFLGTEGYRGHSGMGFNGTLILLLVLNMSRAGSYCFLEFFREDNPCVVLAGVVF